MVSPLSAVCLCVCSCDVFKCVLVEPAVTSLQDTAGHNSRWHPGAIFTEHFTLPPGVLINGTKKFWAKSFSSSEPFRELLGATFTGEWRTLTDYFLCYNPSALPTVSKKKSFGVSFFSCKKVKIRLVLHSLAYTEHTFIIQSKPPMSKPLDHVSF